MNSEGQPQFGVEGVGNVNILDMNSSAGKAEGMDGEDGELAKV